MTCRSGIVSRTWAYESARVWSYTRVHVLSDLYGGALIYNSAEAAETGLYH